MPNLPAANLPKILLVDDNDVFRNALKATLEGEGYAVTVAANGKIAKDIVGLDNYAVVVSDIRMSPVNGIELLHYINNSRPVPVVLMTGFSELMETQEAASIGAAGFLAKPFRGEELIGILGRILGISPQIETPRDKTKPTEVDYCPVGIDDFISGSEIKFDIFIKLSAISFVKIAHRGENMPVEQIRNYKGKGLSFLYLRKEDFKKYVGFNISLGEAVANNENFDKAKKLNFFKHATEVAFGQIYSSEIAPEQYQQAKALVENTISIIAESATISDVLEALNTHSDFIYAHSVGVSLYSVLIATELGWKSHATLFKIAMGGLLHDIGKKEIDRKILEKPRQNLTSDELRQLETHPQRGMEILSTVSDIPSDVLQIVLHHHETCIGTGYPAHLRKNNIHPLARLISVANEFCSFVMTTHDGQKLSPLAALEKLRLGYAEQLDSTFLNALTRLITSPGADAGSIRKAA